MAARDVAAAGLAVALLALGWLDPAPAGGTAGGPAAGPAPSFQVYHFGSVAEGTAFREVFLVHAVEGAVPVAGLEVRRNGVAFPVTWETRGPELQVNDTFWFVDEAFDQKQILTAHLGGAQVMDCAYGGGAGISIHPDEWRAMGLPEQVRCLQLMDDQMAPE